MSKRLIKQLATFLFLLVIVWGANAPYESFVRTGYQDLQTDWRKSGVVVREKAFGVSFPLGLHLDQVAVQFLAGQVPVVLLLDTLDIRPSLLSILMLRFKGNANASFYGGKLEGNFNRPLLGSNPGTRLEVQLDGSGVQLGKHMFFQGLGIDGELKLDSETTLISVDQYGAMAPVAGSGTLSLVGGKIRAGSRVMGLFELPATEDANLEIRWKLADAKLGLEKAVLKSSIGEVSGGGHMLFTSDFQQTKECDIDLQIDIADAGKSIVPYLMLAAGRQLSSDNPGDGPRSWMLSIRQSEGGQPSTKFAPRT